MLVVRHPPTFLLDDKRNIEQQYALAIIAQHFVLELETISQISQISRNVIQEYDQDHVGPKLEKKSDKIVL